MIKKWVGLLLIIVLVSGCANKNKSKNKEPEIKKDPTELLPLDTGYQLKILWQRQAGGGFAKRYHHKLLLAASADRLYVVDVFGFVAALDAKTGETIWQVNVPPSEQVLSKRGKHSAFISAGPGIGDGLLFLGSTQGEVIALSDRDGSLVWRSTVASEVLAPPQVGAGLVFVQTSDGRLLALRLKDGEQVWLHKSQIPRLSLRGTATPVFVDGRVLIGQASGKVALLTAEQGDLVWEQRVASPKGSSELERIVDVDHAPLISSGVVYAAAYQGNVRAFDLRDGGILWEHKVNTGKSLVTGFGQVYVIDEDDQIIALNDRSGMPLWTNQALLYRDLASPVAFRNYLSIGDEKGYVHLFNQSDGAQLTYAKVGKVRIHSAPIFYKGVLYVLDSEGTLSALQVLITERNLDDA